MAGLARGQTHTTLTGFHLAGLSQLREEKTGRGRWGARAGEEAQGCREQKWILGARWIAQAENRV